MISISAWTWSATLLQSSTAAYTFGIYHNMWYGAGGSIQVPMSRMVTAKVNMNPSSTHTFLEIVKARFGVVAHIVFTTCAFFLPRVEMVTDACFSGRCCYCECLTGMNILAAYFLLPIGIVVYVVFGGLRATFMCD
ncbi:uncharacterized protein HD556DRAFT_1245125 [Suillus plorans]|uniref:Uncharacterized protein n=1 Tax=Suillus plorans TaxID=116603 RepID=A0A9P7AHG1_9AGAM|nr:uncharacterized protein HD556DRAFT_1245125 [Suillus plorans]KAG1788412.1 hypothetical protein HD556DRAFT_1245125 [Suillus plorans]